MRPGGERREEEESNMGGLADGEEEGLTYEDMMAKPRTGTQVAVASVLKADDEKKKAKRDGVEGKRAVLGEKRKPKSDDEDEEEDNSAAKEAGPIMEVRVRRFPWLFSRRRLPLLRLPADAGGGRLGGGGGAGSGGGGCGEASHPAR